MLHNCPYCQEEFNAKRRDKIYCSNSCKQMAFIKRCENTVGVAFTNTQSVHAKRQVAEPSIVQNVKPSIKNIDVSKVKQQTQKPDSLIYEEDDDEKKNYVPIRCKWIDEVFKQFDKRGCDTWLKVLPYDMEKRVEWVGIHYRCLLDCVIILSEIKAIAWADLAEVTNALTFLSSSNYFKGLPNNYPFTKDIVLLRDKLKCFCLETQSEIQVQFDVNFSTKKDLLLQRYELSTVYSKISFNQLQLDFEIENQKQIQKIKEEKQEALEPEKEKPWRIAYRALKRKEEREK